MILLSRPFGTLFPSKSNPRLKPWAIVVYPSGTISLRRSLGIISGRNDYKEVAPTALETELGVTRRLGLVRLFCVEVIV